jgi:hypothetical protein
MVALLMSATPVAADDFDTVGVGATRWSSLRVLAIESDCRGSIVASKQIDRGKLLVCLALRPTFHSPATGGCADIWRSLRRDVKGFFGTLAEQKYDPATRKSLKLTGINRVLKNAAF